MENGIEKAIEQMRLKDEAGLNYIYSKTYNFVYLRSKNILKNEEDVKRLMQDVYLQAYASADGLERENLYEWLGKRTYLLGCQRYKKRKEREISFLEMEKEELHLQKKENTGKAIEILCGVLGGLPDMYQATMYAFYYDYLKIDEIAELMNCSPDVIKNRLNYVRKYMKKALEEEQAGIDFSVELLCNTLRKWSVDHCLGITIAQSVYSAICKEAKLANRPVYLEGKEFAGVNNTVIYHKQDDLNALEEEIILHEKKKGIDKRLISGLVCVGVVVLIVIVAAAMAFGRPKKEKPVNKNKQVETQKEDPKDEPEAEPDESADETAEGQEPVAEEPAAPSEYIFENSNTVELTREEIQAHTKEELRFGRNEIYARHGVIFGVEDLDAYFQGKSWYNPTISLDDFMDTVEMSLIEEKNISLISEVEASM